MPKPVFGDNGTGMHVHQSIWKDGKPLFAGDQYADLSEPACTTSAASSSTPRR
jgi:glutamine synthetase